MRIFGMGMPELLIILAVALLIFGPKNLPKLGASLGKTVKSLRKGMEDDEEASKKDGVTTIVDDDADADEPVKTKVKKEDDSTVVK